MDGSESRVLQSLDSLWFFTSIFSRKPQKEDPNSRDSNGEPSFIDKDEVFSAIESKPISQIIKIERNGSPMCLKCVENETPSPKSAEKRRGTRRSKRRCKREVFGELDLGMEGPCWPNSMLLDEVERYVLRNSPSPSPIPSPSPRNGGQNLPPLNVNDGKVMKEHIRSWAYAVACTVK